MITVYLSGVIEQQAKEIRLLKTDISIMQIGFENE